MSHNILTPLDRYFDERTKIPFRIRRYAIDQRIESLRVKYRRDWLRIAALNQQFHKKAK